MADDPQQWLVFVDGSGTYYKLPRALVERSRVPESELAATAQALRDRQTVRRVGARTVIRPPWRDYTPGPDDVVVTLDPGAAFGNGLHPSTQLCLVALEERLRPGMRVLDVGTGSGILAIAAAKLGAASVLAVDTEPQAVTVARENAARNGVEGRVTVRHGSLGAEWPFPQAPIALGELIIANIHARVLLDLAADLAAALRTHGTLVLSGIISDRDEDVRHAYQGLGLHVVDAVIDGEWRTIALQREDAVQR